MENHSISPSVPKESNKLQEKKVSYLRLKFIEKIEKNAGKKCRNCLRIYALCSLEARNDDPSFNFHGSY